MRAVFASMNRGLRHRSAWRSAIPFLGIFLSAAVLSFAVIFALSFFAPIALPALLAAFHAVLLASVLPHIVLTLIPVIALGVGVGLLVSSLADLWRGGQEGVSSAAGKQPVVVANPLADSSAAHDWVGAGSYQALASATPAHAASSADAERRSPSTASSRVTAHAASALGGRGAATYVTLPANDMGGNSATSFFAAPAAGSGLTSAADAATAAQGQTAALTTTTHPNS